MTLAPPATVSVADVDASIARVIQHAESIWDEWAWQVENETWLIKGYASWDEMRRAVYGGLSSVTAPRAERPELVARFRRAGLTQRETAETLGVSKPTVERYENPHQRASSNDDPDPDVIDAEVVEDDEDDAPQGYVNTATGEVSDDYQPAVNPLACRVYGVSELKELLREWDESLAPLYLRGTEGELNALAAWLNKHIRKTTRKTGGTNS